ncbi:MAG: hypothetical protein H7Y01_02670, partial [Ferruginibacter sp.]|nr:hypothetical protein [Chitinophagaceae bacterium]
MKFFFFLSGITVRFFIASKKVIRLVILFGLLLLMEKLNAQPWIENISKENINFYEIQKTYYNYSKRLQQENPGTKDGSYKKFKRWEWFMEPRVYPSGDITLPSRNWEEFQKYLNSFQFKKAEGNSSLRTTEGNWTPLGPFTAPSNFPVGYGGVGRIDFIRFDPTNSNIMWAGAPSGGLWKSINGGISWTTNTDLLTMIGCADVVISPTNTNIMYLATGDKDHFATNSIGVLKSTDGGTTWNPTGLSWPVNHYYRIHKLLMHPTNPGIIFVASNVGIYKTTDAGFTWTLTQAGNFSDIEFKPGTLATIYAVTKSGGLFYKSTDTGETFNNISSGLPAAAEIDRYAIAVTPANPNYVYILAVNKTNFGFYGLYRSTNSGNNFSTRSTSPDIIGGNGWYNLSIAINPVNRNDVYVGGIYQYRSTDGGVTWFSIEGTHVDSHALEFLPGSSTTIFSGNDGGIHKSTDNGTSWNDISNGLTISQIYRLGTSGTDPNLNITGLQDNGTDRLSNDSWTWVLGGDGMECIIDYNNPDIMYAAYQNGVVNKSIDGGDSFSPIVYNDGSGINAPGAWVTPYIIHPTESNTLLVGKDQVYRSRDGGLIWTQVGSVSAGEIYMRALAYAPSNPDYIYASFLLQFFSTTDGNTFTNRTGTLPVGSATIAYIAVSNTNPNKVWVTFSGYADGEKVYMSDDAGVTWTNYSAGLPNLPANCIVYQNGSNDALYVGTDVGVYYRNNSMSSWQPFFDGLPNVIVNELEIHYGAGKIRAATYGRGLWESDLVTSCTVPTYIWTGAVSTAWENPENWSCGVFPDANSD